MPTNNSSYIHEGGYITAVDSELPTTVGTGTIEQFTPPISLTDPSNVFVLQNSMSNNLNNFQAKYARYIRCQGPPSYSQVTDPPCDVDGGDSFDSLNIAYQSLLSSINDLSGSFATQVQNNSAETPLQYDVSGAQIPIDYASILKLRQELDLKLRELQVQYNGGPNTSVRLLESTMFANTLWVILASCLVYYIFTEL